MDPQSNTSSSLKKKPDSVPVPPQSRKYRKYSPPDNSLFFETKERLGTVAAAARELGFSPSTVLTWSKDDSRMSRTKSFTEQKDELFVVLDALGNVSAAARQLGINTQTGFHWAYSMDAVQRKPHRQLTAKQRVLAPKKTKFLAALERMGNISLAARETEIKYTQGHSWDRAAGVENIRQDRSAKQTQYTRLPAPVSIEDLEQVLDARYLSHPERELIADLLRAGQGIRAISRELGRSPSSISREIIRNSHPRLGYQPHGTQRTATKPGA